ncbi:hypothetical protein JXR93_08495 [bacterium]|nr:hypothetical protein [bacterium]
MIKNYLFLYILLGLLYLTSCGNSFTERVINGKTVYVDRNGNICNKLPKWVEKLPIKSGKIYAIGFSMPDTIATRSLEIAKRKAIIELSKTVETIIKIDSTKLDEFVRVKNGANAVNKESITTINYSVRADVVKIVSGGIFEEVFYDNCNLSGRGENAHFVLISLSKK